MVMRKYFWHLSSLCSLVLLLSLGGSVVPLAAASPNISGAVTQSYNAGPSVLTGMIVELKPKDPTTVIPLNSNDIRNMLGVVVPLNDASIVLTPQSVSTQQVLVATANRHSLLVSNQNGPIKTGDYLTVSSLAGIGMEAGIDQTEIIGRAAADFTGSNNVIGSVPLKSSLGRTTNVNIGYIPVDVYLAPNPLSQKNANNLPGFLTKMANAFTNQSVSSFRVYLSAIMLLGTLVITGIIFYSGVRNSIVAIGRNPLAKKTIGRSMLQTIVIGLIIFVVGIFAVYLILNLNL
jgi:hypothetical protein